MRQAFDIPKHYRLIVGLSMGFASDHPVNQYNPGRAEPYSLLLPTANR